MISEKSDSNRDSSPAPIRRSSSDYENDSGGEADDGSGGSSGGGGGGGTAADDENIDNNDDSSNMKSSPDGDVSDKVYAVALRRLFSFFLVHFVSYLV